MKTYTTAEYAYEHDVSRDVARKRLDAMVDEGRATVKRNAVIGHVRRRGGGKLSNVPSPVRGNLYTLVNADD